MHKLCIECMLTRARTRHGQIHLYSMHIVIYIRLYTNVHIARKNTRRATSGLLRAASKVAQKYCLYHRRMPVCITTTIFTTYYVCARVRSAPLGSVSWHTMALYLRMPERITTIISTLSILVLLVSTLSIITTIISLLVSLYS